MCTYESKPSTDAFKANMRQDMPLSTKMRLVVRNNFKKATTRKNCCGNHGEPGC
ncbi:MAG: hypothetical protein PF636_05840 [Actinomycetota bacterium]|jgi:hypothetical protein|nr:hypothetical protein [Actinomycetota bacterium]